MNNLEKIIGKFFEVNKINFSYNELPVEGRGHNWGLYITVKCDYFYIICVMIEGGFGANICPLTTLQMWNISTKRI